MNNADVELKVGKELPADQLLELYESVGWLAYTRGKRRDELQQAVCNSSYVVSAWIKGRMVGLARGLSDDLAIFFLQDILVDPDYQGQGVGRRLIENCLERFAHVRSRVLLTDDDEKQLRFYESVGFRNTKALEETPLNTFVSFKGME